MASVLLYPIAYGLELFLASALSTQIAVSLAAVLVSTAAVIYCQRTVALWWSLTSTTTQTRTNIIRPHAVVNVTEELYDPETDPPRDRGGGQLAPSQDLPIKEKEKETIKEDLISAATTPIFTVAATRRKLSDDSEGSTEGSLNGEEGSETRRRRKSSSGSNKEGQPEQSWLNRQPAYMHRSHWVAKPAQPRNNPLLYKPSLLRRASADNNGHHHPRVVDFATTAEITRRRVDEDDIHDGGERGREKPRKPTLDRRSSFPSSLPSSSATSLLQSPRMQASSSLVTTLMTSSSTSSPTSTPSCSVATRQSSSSSDDHGSDTAEGIVKPVLSGGESETEGHSAPQKTPSRDLSTEKKHLPSSRSLSSPLPSITVMAPATIHEESEATESAIKIPTSESPGIVVPKVSFTTELTPTPLADVDVRILESRDPGRNKDGEKEQSPSLPKKRIALPIICIESESDKSDSDTPANTSGESSPPVNKSNDLFVKFSVRPAFERPPPSRRVSADSASSGPVRPSGVIRKDSLGIPSVVKGEIAYPGVQRKMPTRRQSEPLTITVQPPAICETKQEKDQTISQEVIRPIPQRADSLGVPQVFTGEASFPMKQPQTGPPGNMPPATVNPKKPPGARRKESLEVPIIATDEVSFPPMTKTVMGPPLERPIKRHRPLSLNIPSLSATSPEECSEDRPPFSAPAAKRKHTSILKRGNSHEKPGPKKSVTFSPTVSPQEIPPEFNFDRESDGAIYTLPKRPKMFRHYSIDSSDMSLRQERYRAAGRQTAQCREAGILFSDDQPNISGVNRTSSDFSSLSDFDMNMSPSVSEGSKDVDMETHTSDMEESDDVFEDSKALEISNAKARFLAAGGARAVMSVLCTQDSSDSNGQGSKYSSVDLLEAEAKTDSSPSDESPQSTSDTTSTTDTLFKEPETTTITIVPETESTRTITTLSSPDKDKSDIGPKRFISSEDLDIRASLLFVETVRSSVESDLSEGRHSHSSEESENSASEDVIRLPAADSNSAKSRFFQSCQETNITPRHHRHHGEDTWNTPTIPELPEPLELDSQDEESTSAARDADIDDSTSTSSSPSYSSSWYGFLELDPSRPSLANLDVEIIESTDNDLSAPLRADDDTGDEVEDDCGRRENQESVTLTGAEDGGRSRRGEGEEGTAVVGRTEDKDDEVKDACPERAPIASVGVPLTEAGAPAEESRSVGSSKDDALRHQWPLAVSSASSPGQSRHRRHFNTPIIIDNGTSMVRAGLADGVAPSVTIPTVVGRLKKDLESFRHRKDLYVGNELTKKYGLVCVSNPMKGGLIDNWSELEYIWDHVIKKELNVTWEDHPILLTEVASAPKRQRERVLEVLFETYKTPACFVANQGALALHANGETSGLVLSSGSGVTEIVPVYQGCTMSHAVTTMPAAGRGVTRRLQRILMDERAFSVSTPFDHRILQEMKENMAYVCKDYETEMSHSDLTTPIKYSLPDGSSVMLRKRDLFHCSETIFRPDIVGLPQKGLVQVLSDCLEKCNPEFLAGLDPTILLAGGNTKLRGFTERLQHELDKGDFNRAAIAPDNRDITTWIGGAILASHSSFADRLITSEDFEEFGTSLVHKQTI
nr:mucin-5AC-like [Lytechinus pictus]